jgi:hypothetical protein
MLGLARASEHFEATLPYLREGQAVRDVMLRLLLMAYTSQNNTAACKNPVSTASKRKP